MTIKECSIGLVLSTALFVGCCGGNNAPPPPAVTVGITRLSAPMNAGSSHTFSASVKNSANQAVTWSVVEAGGGTITRSGVYSAPATPATYTVKATALADSSASATAAVPVVIPEGHIAGYDVGVDYHATGADFLHTTFITIYDQPGVRQFVRSQLQGMAGRGATVISTRTWLVTEPGSNNFGETWRATFPLTDKEPANLRAYAQDAAVVQGSGVNPLRLDLCLLWLGAADYAMGTPSRSEPVPGLGVAPAQVRRLFTAHCFTCYHTSRGSDLEKGSRFMHLDNGSLKAHCCSDVVGSLLLPRLFPTRAWLSKPYRVLKAQVQ